MSLTYTARLLKCDEPTSHSGNIYPTDEVKKAIDAYMDTIDVPFKLGEMDGTSSDIDLDRVSHRIVKTYVDDDGWWVAEIETLATPMGNILRQLLEAGIEPTITPRSMGNVNDSAQISNLHIIALDVVAKSEE
jgi:hypothetical protein